MSMDYTLAKELKDAGFPQHYPWPCGCDGPVSCLDHTVIRPPYIPTLEGLVVACQSFKEDLDILVQPLSDGRYYAGAHLFGYTEANANGKTDLEAVARLWLELKRRL